MAHQLIRKHVSISAGNAGRIHSMRIGSWREEGSAKRKLVANAASVYQASFLAAPTANFPARAKFTA